MKYPLLLPHFLLLLLLLTLWDDDHPLPLLPTAHALQGTRLHGINYGLRIGPDWTSGTDRCKSYDRTISELTKLKEITNNVRVYSMTDCDTASILLSATQHVGDLGLWLGLWVGPNQLNFEEERARLLQLLNDDNVDVSNVIGIHVASEAIYREDITVEQAIDMRDIIKADLDELGVLADIPVTVTDITDTYRRYTELIEVDPIAITTNQFPFWEKSVININGDGPGYKPDYPSAAEYFESRFKFVEQRVGDRQVIITETGWADAGENEHSNVASPAAMAKWMRDFVCLAEAKGWQYFWFNAFDSDWRRVNEQKPDDVEGHFGIFDEEGNMKPHMKDLVIDCSQPYYNIDPDATPAPTTQLPTALPTTAAPSKEPTGSPTKSQAVTATPTLAPTEAPTTASPIGIPTKVPVTDASTTASPTGKPTESPTKAPVAITDSPTQAPTPSSTNAPVLLSTDAPTTDPTKAPVAATETPTLSPTKAPVAATEAPTSSPTKAPVAATETPTSSPTKAPVAATETPTSSPTKAPVDEATEAPTSSPTGTPTAAPTAEPTKAPVDAPTESPTDAPTKAPTDAPTKAPTYAPTESPTDAPTKAPADAPTKMPNSTTKTPTIPPTDAPTMSPFRAPSSTPSLVEAAPAAIQSLVDTSSASALLVWLPNAAVLLTCFLALL